MEGDWTHERCFRTSAAEERADARGVRGVSDAKEQGYPVRQLSFIVDSLIRDRTVPLYRREEKRQEYCW